MDRRRFLGACGRGAILLAATGCSKYLPTAPGEDSELSEVSPVMLATGPAWEGNIKSEAYYALCEQRTGTSHKVYQGLAMGDWDYPHQGDCCDALTKVTGYMYRNPSDRGPLGLWKGQYRQCGWCKFFVNFVLYRSSYGYPGGHLVLPPGYSWGSQHSYDEAQPGWILQSTMPHSAIVVKRLGGGLDVIDSNWTGTYQLNPPDGPYVYSYAISRHAISWSKLEDWSFKAYRAHEVCRLIA